MLDLRVQLEIRRKFDYQVDHWIGCELGLVAEFSLHFNLIVPASHPVIKIRVL